MKKTAQLCLGLILASSGCDGGGGASAADSGTDAAAPRSDAGSQPASEHMVQLPSDFGGADGIAIHVLAPASPGRYAEGAPIAVTVMGGWSATSVADVNPRFPEHGIVSVGWVFPGSVTPAGTSGGTFDVRGPNCLGALADVLLYAMGRKADAEGQLITDRIPHALTSEVGLIAGSNGGNLAITTLAEYEAELSSVAWLAAWESPIGDQQANVELNDNADYSPGNCDATTCVMSSDYGSHLVWSPTGSTGARHDPRIEVDGRLSSTEGSTRLFESMPAGFVGEDLFFYPSQETAAAIRANATRLFGSEGPPAWLQIDEGPVAEYWSTRDGALRIPELHASNPDLLVMHLQRQSDHVQTQPDYPHATAHLRGWDDAGHAWFRLNPDAAYQALALGDDAAMYVENDAGGLVQYPGARDQMVPDALGRDLQLAAVLELTDRAHLDERSADIDAVLVDFEGGDSGGGGGPGATPCTDTMTTRCCGDGVCDGPESASSCPSDC